MVEEKDKHETKIFYRYSLVFIILLACLLLLVAGFYIFMAIEMSIFYLFISLLWLSQIPLWYMNYKYFNNNPVWTFTKSYIKIKPSRFRKEMIIKKSDFISFDDDGFFYKINYKQGNEIKIYRLYYLIDADKNYKQIKHAFGVFTV